MSLSVLSTPQNKLTNQQTNYLSAAPSLLQEQELRRDRFRREDGEEELEQQWGEKSHYQTNKWV